jgi:hypothetical protein
MKRLLLSLSLVAVASVASATLIQSWNKSITLGGSPTIFEEDVLDSSGNVYAVGTVLAADNDVFLTKINSAGSTQWTNRLSMAGDQNAHEILNDGAGNIWYSYTYTATHESVGLKKIRASDGATLGTYTITSPSFTAVSFGDLIMDDTGQIYWITERWYAGALRYLEITKVNSATLAASTSYLVTIPIGQDVIQCLPKPGGGVFFTLGSNDLPLGGFLDGRFFDADVYTYTAPAAIKSAPIGKASRIAINPVNSYIYGMGGVNENGNLGRSRMPINGTVEAVDVDTTTNPLSYIRDALITKNQTFLGVGATDTGSPNQQDSLFVGIDYNSGLFLNFQTVIPGTFSNDIAETIRSDSFAEITATENSGARILELDEYTGLLVDSKPISYFIGGHAVNAVGQIAVCGNSGGITYFRPRDLKDIYMASSTMHGGDTATLNIRMYEVYGGGRTITLSDNSSHLSLPASKIIPGAASTGTVTVTTTAVTVPEVVTITAAFGNQQRRFKVTLNP